MQRQFRLVETLVIAFVAAAVASLAAAGLGSLNVDNWRAVVPGLIVAAIVAGGKAAMVAWTNTGGTP